MFAESEVVEFKREFSKTVLKTVVAFANTKGGVLYLGIDDDGSICGLDDPDAVMLTVVNSIRDSIKPDASVISQCERLEMKGKQIVGIRIERGPQRPYYLGAKGLRPEGVFVREGSGSFMATKREILELIRGSEGDSYETRPAFVKDLTFEGTKSFFDRRKVAFGEAPMRSMGLLDSNMQWTNLALLLSDQCPFDLRLAQFSGTKRTTIKERCLTTGSLLVQLEEAQDFLDRHNAVGMRIQGLFRNDYEDYPPFAVREALINAVAHRDYDIESPTLISVLADKMQFLSHGGLPGSLSFADFESDVSNPRNPKLAAVFYRLGLIEAYGTGIGRIFESYEGSGMAPVFDMTKSLFKATLPNRNYEHEKPITSGMEFVPNGSADNDELRKQERLVLTVLDDFGPQRRSEIQERFDFSQATLLRILKRLEDKGLVRAEGNTRRRVYVATAQAATAN